jgi:hypothetical protein
MTASVLFWPVEAGHIKRIALYWENYRKKRQGSGPYFIQSPGRKSRAVNTSGADWVTKLKKTDTLSAGTYEWAWAETIRLEATPGSGAKAKVLVKLFDVQGGNLIQKRSKFHTVSIAP